MRFRCQVRGRLFRRRVKWAWRTSGAALLDLAETGSGELGILDLPFRPNHLPPPLPLGHYSYSPLSLLLLLLSSMTALSPLPHFTSGFFLPFLPLPPRSPPPFLFTSAAAVRKEQERGQAKNPLFFSPSPPYFHTFLSLPSKCSSYFPFCRLGSRVPVHGLNNHRRRHRFLAAPFPARLELLRRRGGEGRGRPRQQWKRTRGRKSVGGLTLNLSEQTRMGGRGVVCH